MRYFHPPWRASAHDLTIRHSPFAMPPIFVSGLINIETTLRIKAFPLEYNPVNFPFFGIQSAVAGVGYNVSKALTALVTYSYWLAQGAPTGEVLPGRGYPVVAEPAGGYDLTRGEQIYQASCAICHGADGQGQKVGESYVFPPLWGPDSYNWGAGMHRINTAAGFIKGNMPLGHGGSLSDQEAWDVAAFMNSHERPQDPRFEGDVNATRERFHQHPGFYGRELNGKILGRDNTDQ